jgi:hypothetical protein
MTDDPFVSYKDAFYIDGSLRDIYVLGTDEQDWQKLLTFLRTGPYSIEFTFDGQPISLPEQVETIFALRSEHGIELHIDKEHLVLNCFFFTDEEIEFDLDPHDYPADEFGEQQIARLLDLMRTIGKLLNKAVILTPENCSRQPLFRFDPETNEEKWFLDNIEERKQWLKDVNAFRAAQRENKKLNASS